MNTDDSVKQMVDSETPVRARKAGRPQAIPEALHPVVAVLYQKGYGYRAMARILREEYQINPHYSSVRLLLKRLGLLLNIGNVG